MGYRFGGCSLGRLREQIEWEDLRQAYRAGRMLGMDETGALARTLLKECSGMRGSGKTEVKRPLQESLLSAREQDVLQLVAEGPTSKQIGRQLFHSHRTVDHHLTSVYNKLGVDSRAQVVAVAVTKGHI